MSAAPPSLRIDGADLGDGRGRSITLDGRRVTLGDRTTATTRFDAAGGAVLPGLHDHHLHLLAMAARLRSIGLGPPAVTHPGAFDDAVATAHRRLPPGAWLRGVGHEDEVGGPLDRHRLDRLAPGRPVRVQHHSGALWTLSSPALHAVAIDPDAPGDARPEGIELDETGATTGRAWRLDEWLRERLPDPEPLDLTTVGRKLAAHGITGATDATPTDDPSTFALLAAAVGDGRLPIELTVTGGPSLAGTPPPAPLRQGPVKLLVTDHDLPPFDGLAAAIAGAHDAGRTVAIHCVSRVAAALALAAWREAGCRAGDRMEHGGVLDRAAVAELAAFGVTVVTQPAFVRDRGDHYLDHGDDADAADLYRCASLLAAGVPVAGSSDAPHGDADPWRAIAAAIERRTAGGRTIGSGERLDARRAVDLYLGTADDPGGPPRRIVPGAPADLCVLDRPLADALADPAAVTVVLTVRRGRVSHLADGATLA